MRDITARSPQDTLSFSRRHFKWPVLGKSRSSSHGGGMSGDEYYMKSSEAEEEEEEEEEGAMAFSSACPSFHSDGFLSPTPPPQKPRPTKAAQAQAQEPAQKEKQRKAKKVKTAVARIRSALSAAVSGRRRQVGMGARLAGTLYGHRRGRVHLAFQTDPRACPALLLELAAPTAALVREMASGLVRIALECERGKPKGGAGAGAGDEGGRRLVEETVWRAYVNGRSCGFAARRECGAADWRVLRALEPVSMGAGVIPAASGGGIEGDVMYMRARFERVVGSRDSEAFYMMNPDNSSGGGGGNNGGPELSVYLLRV